MEDMKEIHTKRENIIFAGLMVWGVISLVIAVYVMLPIINHPEKMTELQGIASVFVTAIIAGIIWFAPAACWYWVGDWKYGRRNENKQEVK